MLSVNLIREVPEAMKPRKIVINAEAALPAGANNRQIVGEKAA